MENSFNVENDKGNIQQPWWRKRSKTEKKLFIFSACALLTIIVLVIVLIVFFTRSASTTCLSEDCIRESNELLEYMNTSVDPCDDFYQFSCGTFLTNTQLRGSPTENVDTLLSEIIKDRILEIVEEPPSQDDSRAMTLAKKLYKGCIDKQSAVEGKGLMLIRDSLKQIGGWPLLEGNNWNEKDFEWKSATYKLRELGYGFEFFILLRIKPDETNPLKRIIRLDEVHGALYHPSDEIFNNFIVDMAIAFGAEKAKAKTALNEVLEFQKVLFMDSNENESDKHDTFTMSELQYQFHDIPLQDYINKIFFPIRNIANDQKFVVANTAYFLRLQDVLKTTPKRVIANYIAWSTVVEQSVYLTTETWMWNLMTKHDPSGNNDDVTPPRGKICSQLINHVFPWPIKAIYIKKYFSEETKVHATMLFERIKDEFEKVITNLKWMDQETRSRALKMLTTTKDYIGFPNYLMNVDEMEKRYKEVQVYEDNYLASLLNVNYHATNLRFQTLVQPVEMDEAFNLEYITSVRSYYSAEDNTIKVPAGILQGIYYDEKRCQYLNYGALGSTLGQLLFHVIVEETNRQERSMQTQSLYNESLSCVAKHYGKYWIPEIGHYLNSSNTKDKDFADMAGVKLAYNVYEKLENGNGKEPTLPGITFTPKQLFWISSAIRFCQKSIPEAIEDVVAHYSTSPGKYRVLGVLQNSEEFSNDFNCPVDSYMNKEDKCSTW